VKEGQSRCEKGTETERGRGRNERGMCRIGERRKEKEGIRERKQMRFN
jgi:hypothetical protein